MIAKLDFGQQSCTKDVREEFALLLVDLNMQSKDLRSAKRMLCLGCRIQLVNSKDRSIEENNSIDKLAAGVLFYEGNQSVGKDLQKAARYLNAAVNAGKFRGELLPRNAVSFWKWRTKM